MRKNPLPGKSSQQHTPVSNQRHRITIRQSNRGQHETNTTNSWLHINTRIISAHIQCKQHEACRPKRRQLPQQTKSKKPSGRPFLPIKQLHRSTQQRSCPQHCPHYQTCHDISNRGWAGCIIYHGTRSSFHSRYPWRNGIRKPPMPLQTDNTMADVVINGKVQPKWTKTMNMQFNWLQDRECQEQFCIYWRPGKLNYADYWTKHHAAKHHHNIRR